MSRFQLPAVLLLLSSFGGAANAAEGSGSGSLPAEVEKLLARASLCTHLAGEYTAVGSARNAEVSEAVRKTQCDFVDQELDNIKRKYASNPMVVQKVAEQQSKVEK